MILGYNCPKTAQGILTLVHEIQKLPELCWSLVNLGWINQWLNCHIIPQKIPHRWFTSFTTEEKLESESCKRAQRDSTKHSIKVEIKIIPVIPVWTDLFKHPYPVLLHFTSHRLASAFPSPKLYCKACIKLETLKKLFYISFHVSSTRMQTRKPLI